MARGNSFTFLRLAFALAVVYAHSFPLGGFGDDPLGRLSKGSVHCGAVAVISFFIVSGFLIAGSAARQSSIFQFALNRAARILPGFWAVQLLTVFVLTPAIMLARYGGKIGYWDSIVTGPYAAMDYLLLNAYIHVVQYPIADLFLNNPGGPAVNGSLWSLCPEVVCYVYLGVLAVLGGLRWRFTGLLLLLGAYILHIVLLHQSAMSVGVAAMLEKGWIYHFDVPLFRSVFVAFLAGLTCYQFRDALRWHGWLATAAFGVLLGACWVGAFDYVWPFALPYVVLYLAQRLPFERVEQWGDFSYGIYIYAFPIQQCLALAGVQRFGFLVYFGLSAALAVLAGMASWFALERPVLNWARNLGRESSRAQALEPLCPAEQLPERI